MSGVGFPVLARGRLTALFLGGSILPQWPGVAHDHNSEATTLAGLTAGRVRDLNCVIRAQRHRTPAGGMVAASDLQADFACRERRTVLGTERQVTRERKGSDTLPLGRI